MTKVELAVTKLSKTPCKCVQDYVKLVNYIGVLKKRNWSTDQSSALPTALKNYNGATSRNKYLRELLAPAYQMFATLHATDIFTKYIIWWAYTVYNDKLIRKYVVTDVVNDNLLNKFISWLTIYVTNINVLTEFNRSCKFITVKSKSAENVLCELIASDKLATAHITGNISSYALAAISDNVLKKANFKKSPFSKQLFDNVRANQDYLLGVLNQACENIIKTPVDFIAYVNAIYRSK